MLSIFMFLAASCSHSLKTPNVVEHVDTQYFSRSETVDKPSFQLSQMLDQGEAAGAATDSSLYKGFT